MQEFEKGKFTIKALRAPPRYGFFFEQSLGNVVFAKRLKRCLSEISEVNATYYDLDPQKGVRGFWAGVCRRNWTLFLGQKVISILRSERRQGIVFDALYFHTQVAAIFPLLLTRHTPIIISMDATPIQLDEMGAHYSHSRSRLPGVENLKKRILSRAFKRATHIIAFSQWCKASILNDYGVPSHRVTVIGPGVDQKRWKTRNAHTIPLARPRILFVGNDSRRKGLEVLLRVFLFRFSERAELHILSQTFTLPRPLPGVFLHSSLVGDSLEMIDLYRSCQIFALPSQAEMSPLVIVEAMVAGLAIVTSAVGALPEMIKDHQEGLLINPGDELALGDSLELLLGSQELRTKLTTQSYKSASDRFDLEKNTRAVLEVLRNAVAERDLGVSPQACQNSRGF